MKFFTRKRIILLSIFLGIPMLLILFRYPILRGMGNYLVHEDSPEKVDAIFVLSGSPKPRGYEAAKWFLDGYSPKVICTGEEVAIPSNLNYGLDTVFTAEMTRHYVISAGVDSSSAEILFKGTSTFEEYEAIRDFSKEKGFTKIMVISSKFHTRRISKVFHKPMETAGIKVIIRGAPEPKFNPDCWWNNEEGLIFVNNEYVKLFYYAFKY